MTHIKRNLFWNRFVVSALAVMLGAALATDVAATPVGPLAGTSDALNNISGPDAGFWRGTSSLTSGSFAGTVDFAVFGPGSSFQDFLDAEYLGDGFADPTGGAEYVYAFQARADSSEGIQRLNAGFDLGANVGSLGAPQTLPGSGDSAPGGGNVFNDTSAQWGWSFSGPTLASGQTSDVLYYTSDFGPKPDQVTIAATAFANQANSGPTDFASPVPEPASALIMLVAASMGLGLARRRGQSC